MYPPVEFGLALSNSFPSGTGSYSYNGSFKIVVQDLAFEKQVAIAAQTGSGWSDIPASFSQLLPENRQLWIAPASNSEGHFAAKYMVNGTTYWDNNDWTNYEFPQAFDEFLALPGRNYKVVLGRAGLGAGLLHVDIGVQNLAYAKVVGIVYTTNDWATAQTAHASYNYTMESGLEVWHLDAGVGAAAEVKLAIFYQVLGAEYWDNNFWRNYRVAPGTSVQWGDAP